MSERSRWLHIDIPAAPERPDKPRGLSATASHDQVVLTWDDPGDDSITGYVILRRNRQTTVSGQFSELVADTGSAATTYTDDTVAAETNYTYRIKAINEHGVSPRSRWFHIDTSAAPEAIEGDDQDEQGGEDGGGGAPGRATPPGPGGRANVSEGATDLPADTTTTGEVDVGGSVTGNIETFADGDWFAVVLEAGKTYQIDLEGEYGGGGTLEDPFLENIRDSSGTQIDDTFNDDADFENDIDDSQITFTPTAAGTYYLVASRNGATGTYTLSVREIACTLNTGDIWCGVVTVTEVKTPADVLVAHGFAEGGGLSAGSLAGYPDDTMFSVGDNDYTIQGVYIQVPTGANLTGTLFVSLTADLTDDDKAGPGAHGRRHHHHVRVQRCLARGHHRASTLGVCRAWTGRRRPRLRSVCRGRRRPTTFPPAPTPPARSTSAARSRATSSPSTTRTGSSSSWRRARDTRSTWRGGYRARHPGRPGYSIPHQCDRRHYFRFGRLRQWRGQERPDDLHAEHERRLLRGWIVCDHSDGHLHAVGDRAGRERRLGGRHGLSRHDRHHRPGRGRGLGHGQQRAPPLTKRQPSLLPYHGVHQVEKGRAHQGGHVPADGPLGGGDEKHPAIVDRLSQVDGGAALSQDGPGPLRR